MERGALNALADRDEAQPCAARAEPQSRVGRAGKLVSHAGLFSTLATAAFGQKGATHRRPKICLAQHRRCRRDDSSFEMEK